MVTKLFITPWFGEFPEWFGKYLEQMPKMNRLGYHWYITNDLEDFNKRCKEKLGFESNIVPGTGKLHDFRCALGLLYEDIAKDYDFWGTTDFDCAYGDIGKFVKDEDLQDLDIFSDEVDYIGGHWTLYRNSPEVNTIFLKYPRWKEMMLGPHSGWVEKEFTQTANQQNLRIKYIKQFEMLIHFNHTKKWPIPTK